MNSTVRHIKELKSKIEKLKNFQKRGIVEGFTIDLSYGANKDININRVECGDVSTGR